MKIYSHNDYPWGWVTITDERALVENGQAMVEIVWSEDQPLEALDGGHCRPPRRVAIPVHIWEALKYAAVLEHCLPSPEEEGAARARQNTRRPGLIEERL